MHGCDSEVCTIVIYKHYFLHFMVLMFYYFFHEKVIEHSVKTLKKESVKYLLICG